MPQTTLTSIGEIDYGNTIELKPGRRHKSKSRIKLLPGQTRLSFFKHTKRSHRVRNRSLLAQLSKKIAESSYPDATTLHAPIVVPYRDDGKGAGSFYDHYTLQKCTDRATHISLPPGMSSYYLSRAAHSQTFKIPYGETDTKHGHVMPKASTNHPDQVGLLVLMGLSRRAKEKKLTSFVSRMKHEKALICQAKRYGQPILAICGGAWTLWAAEGGSLKEVTGHSYRGGMSFINIKGSVGRNKIMHRIRFRQGAHIGLLKAAMQTQQPLQTYPAVNSVHWLAPDSKKTPRMFTVCAKAVADTKLRSEKEREQYGATEASTVEAFESRHGAAAPILATQWHPEAFLGDVLPENEPDRHLNIIRYMAAAGDSYLQRRKMVSHFEDILKKNKDPVSLLKPRR